MSKPDENPGTGPVPPDVNLGPVGVDLRHRQPQRSQSKGAAPLMPHERDQSPGKDGTNPPTTDKLSRQVIKQAGEDVEQGQVDTSRGIPSNVPRK
ncbi:MAG: hypothetical protein V4443_05160 [Pseudomonadota bacterium]